MYKYKLNNKYGEHYKEFVLNIKKYFNKSSNIMHKARNELKILEYQNTHMIVKSFKVPNLINQLVYPMIRGSKAEKSYNYGIRLASFTPRPIGYIEFYDKKALKESYFIAEQFHYDFTIREPLTNKEFKDRDKIFKAFARFTLELHNNNIFHKDYSPGNILIKEEGNGYIFKVVDINRMEFFKLSQEDRAKNFSKLWADDNILNIISDEYSKYYSCDDKFKTQVLKFSNKNKKVKNFKKRLKGKKVDN